MPKAKTVNVHKPTRQISGTNLKAARRNVYEDERKGRGTPACRQAGN